jgi:hypothetical protein
MNRLDFLAFTALFEEASLKCFGYPLKDTLTETESKLFCNQLFEHTGLTVGWKSLKNYSLFIVHAADGSGPGSPGKRENPSVATLDTIARYVLNAPYTTETERKNKEGHYPWWYRYREQFHRGRGESGNGSDGPLRRDETESGMKAVAEMGNDGGGKSRPAKKVFFAGTVFVVLAVVIIILTLFFRRKGATSFTDNFHSLAEDSLAARGWFLRSKDDSFWSRRGETPDRLSLFTLKGDNWPDPAETPVIRNLLLRELPCDCFTIELRLTDFIPRQNWQQAGILLLEDTSWTGKSIRITIAYNDYTGGYPRSRQILIQAITSLGKGFGKPEEIAHIPLFNVDSLDKTPVLARNLDNSALRIEKQGQKFRFLYSSGITENTSFKEMASHEFAMSPRYAGLFALKGFVDSAVDLPVHFHYFSLDCDACR